ncbi:hypothetical protein [Paraburkholderia sp. ZP32-5]|uniref:hypothetical protein n=1 Tax=Paraburkholderia sp. ZP32-5 TaxID=2883245 RepID=UPI001F3931E0|nr:hypothetical protein [Paraburkholderia sp. ZP32-5]
MACNTTFFRLPFRPLGAPALFASIVTIALNFTSTFAHAATAAEHFAWPSSFVVMGNGYPHAGDACRRLGESAATANYLDHTAMLVGCPGSSDSAAARAILDHRHARVVGEADGVTLISISTEGDRSTVSHSDPAPVKPTPFSATGTLPCERGGGQTKTMCKFGVVRHGDRSTAVVIFWPDDRTQTIFFAANGRVIGTGVKADDQPVPGNTLTQKNAGISLISIGNERYEITDSVLSGN